MSFSLRYKRILEVRNSSNSKGAAILEVTNLLAIPSHNNMRIYKRGTAARGSHGQLHTTYVKVIFRSTGLFNRLAILRGLLITSRKGKGDTRYLRLLSQFKVQQLTGIGTNEVSNNRLRHTKVYHTLVGEPQLLLLSRPATSLSSTTTSRIMSTVHVLERENITVLLTDRSPHLSKLRSRSLHLRTKGIIVD